VTGGGLDLREREQGRDPFSGHTQHRRVAAATPTAPPYGAWGCWHTGQYTAEREMIVRHRIQYLPEGGGAIGPVGVPSAPGATG
jgi:hypothetical protein